MLDIRSLHPSPFPLPLLHASSKDAGLGEMSPQSLSSPEMYSYSHLQHYHDLLALRQLQEAALREHGTLLLHKAVVRGQRLHESSALDLPRVPEVVVGDPRGVVLPKPGVGPVMDVLLRDTTARDTRGGLDVLGTLVREQASSLLLESAVRERRAGSVLQETIRDPRDELAREHIEHGGFMLHDAAGRDVLLASQAPPQRLTFQTTENAQIHLSSRLDVTPSLTSRPEVPLSSMSEATLSLPALPEVALTLSSRPEVAEPLSPLHVSTSMVLSTLPSSPSPLSRASSSPEPRLWPGPPLPLRPRALASEPPLVMVPSLWRPEPPLARLPGDHVMRHLISPFSPAQSRHHLSELLYKSSEPTSGRRSPGKELPSRGHRHERIRDRQELATVLAGTRTEDLLGVKKSASTQTQFSSFTCERLPPPPYYTTHDTIPPDRLLTTSAPRHSFPSHRYSHPPNVGSLPPPPPPPAPPPHPSALHSHLPPPHTTLTSFLPPGHASQQAYPSSTSTSTSSSSSSSPPVAQCGHTPSPVPPPYSPSQKNRSPPLPPPPPPRLPQVPPPQYTDMSGLAADIQNSPLNLSLSTGSSTPVRVSIRLSRPVSKELKPTSLHSTHVTHESAAQVSDESIEEHFRRSLGQSYQESSPPHLAATPENSAVTQNATLTSSKGSNNLSITGSVDDHFARALGDRMWTSIKAQADPPLAEPFCDTVDAHFAKALGASMWKRLQAETESEDASDSTQQQQQQPQTQQQQQKQHSSSSSSPMHTQLAI